MPVDYVEYHCRCQTICAMELPDFAGSTLRGSFGMALKRQYCQFPSQITGRCEECSVTKSCFYYKVFEGDTRKMEKGNTASHPYIISPMQNCSGQKKTGDLFSFTLLVFGAASNFLGLNDITKIVEEMGTHGLGKNKHKGQGQFVLEKLDIGKGCLYVPDFVDSSGAFQLRVSLLSPLRIKEQNTICKSIDFLGIIRATLRRIRFLEEAFGEDGYKSLDFTKILERAGEIQVIKNDTYLHSCKRYSNRQVRSVPMDGVLGSFVVTGDLLPFFSFLQYASVSHLGKQTVYGLGRIDFERVNEL